MSTAARLEPSLDPLTVDEWVADVRPADDTTAHGQQVARKRSSSATPWLLLVGGAAAFAMLMAFQQVVEGSMRDAPLKRARAERVVACGGADTSPTGVVCSDISSTVAPSSARRSAYAQLSR